MSVNDKKPITRKNIMKYTKNMIFDAQELYEEDILKAKQSVHETLVDKQEAVPEQQKTLVDHKKETTMAGAGSFIPKGYQRNEIHYEWQVTDLEDIYANLTITIKRKIFPNDMYCYDLCGRMSGDDKSDVTWNEINEYVLRKIYDI